MKVNSICIVGGGSSGWMMAIALQKNLPSLEVTLVESPNTPTIGVGEATIPYTSYFISQILGFEEKEWMSYCDASYKAAIRFCDFTEKSKSFYHPFWTAEEETYNGFDWVIKKELMGLDATDYYKTNYVAWHMAENNKFSRLENQELSYAHHMDATKFGEYCKSRFKGKHILANVNHVKTDGSTIVSVTTNKKEIKADMFIDCTGFKGLLIDKALHEPFEPISDTLLNDTAITCRMPYSNKPKELEPFTDCTALSSGWVWNTPLWSRIGTGYVFSSQFQSAEDAQQEYKNYLVGRFGNKRVSEAKFNTVHFKTGKYKRSWVGNCVALTLASGFIEPLESTGLALACYQIESFISLVEDREYSSFKKALYNSKLDTTYEEIHNFILLHYVNSKRDDSLYWKHMKHNAKIPVGLSAYAQDTNNAQWFGKKSKECIHIGCNINTVYSKHTLTWKNKPILNLTLEAKDEILNDLEYLNNTKKEKERLVGELPLLYNYLKKEIYS